MSDIAERHPVIEQIKDRLGPKGWSDDPLRVASKTEDWRGRYKGSTPLLALPGSTEEVADTVRLCAAAGLAITPQGGNTGLVGGGTPQGEVLLSLERMRAVRSVDAENASVVVEAGATLVDVHDAAEGVDRLFPLSLGSQGSATIGGLISTNAGGVGVLRYGMMRDLTLGLEVVTADGSVWNGLRALRKDNTGYDLKQLFIGAEGTLGVVTAAALKLYPRPQAVMTAFCAIDGPEAAPAFLSRARSLSGDSVTAFEIIPSRALDLVVEHIPGARRPIDGDHDWFILLELSLGSTEGAQEVLEATLAEAFEAGLVLDAAIAASDAQAQAFWLLRESIAEAEKKHGVAIKHDVSTPVSAMPTLIRRASEAALAVAPGAELIVFGHVGDGNVHFNVGIPPGMDRETFLARQHDVHQAVHDVAVSLNGSISAEHGIGILKKDELAQRMSPAERALMHSVKQALDPNNIMNPRVLLA